MVKNVVFIWTDCPYVIHGDLSDLFAFAAKDNWCQDATSLQIQVFADEPFRRYIGAKIKITMGAYGNEKRNFSPFDSIGFPIFEPIWRRNGATPTSAIWSKGDPWYQLQLAEIWLKSGGALILK